MVSLVITLLDTTNSKKINSRSTTLVTTPLFAHIVRKPTFAAYGHHCEEEIVATGIWRGSLNGNHKRRSTMSSSNGTMKGHGTANAGSEIMVMPSGSCSLVSQADPSRR